MAERTDKAKHAASFDTVADIYAAVRPGYPQAAADWLVPEDAALVVDVGAGTGKFTSQLRRPGRTVVAVDPSPHMLEQLIATVPDVEVRAGAGERIPLGDGEAHAVTFAQAWHWVDVPAASIEVGRVLRPGGTLGLIWNLRDERVDWVRQMSIAMHADGDQYSGSETRADVREPFGEPEVAQFPWVARHTRDGLLDLVRSRSYFAVMTPDQQRATLADVAELIDTHPQTAGREVIELPYVTVCFRYRRP